jgi:hypothetical protein
LQRRLVAAVASQASALRLEMTTRAPWRAMCMAIALPMPRLEPVMRATLSDRSNSVVMAYLGGGARACGIVPPLGGPKKPRAPAVPQRQRS